MKTQLTIPKAMDLMNRKVYSVAPELSLMELIEFLQSHEITCAPVVEREPSAKRLVGFVSEGDALNLLTDEVFYGIPEPPSVRHCMKKHPISITEDTDLFVIASLLVSHRYRHLPVVGHDNELKGIVSRREVLRAMKSCYLKYRKDHDAEYFPPDLSKIVNLRFVVS
jgi:CBS domain-containing protein